MMDWQKYEHLLREFNPGLEEDAVKAIIADTRNETQANKSLLDYLERLVSENKAPIIHILAKTDNPVQAEMLRRNAIRREETKGHKLLNRPIVSKYSRKKGNR